MSSLHQQDAASALASLSLQGTQESSDPQEELDEDDILHAALSEALGERSSAATTAGELDQHTAQSLAKDRAREKKSKPASGPNYFLKWDPEVPFVPSEFYHMEEGLPPRWDGAGKEEGLDHKDKYEQYMSVGNHNTGPVEWAEVLRARAGPDGVYWGEEIEIVEPVLKKKDSNNPAKLDRAQRLAWKEAYLKSAEGTPWSSLVLDMQDYGFSPKQMQSNDAYMDIKKACARGSDPLCVEHPDYAKLFGTKITLTHTNRDETGNRKNFIFCRRCAYLNATDAIRFRAIPIAKYRYRLGASRDGAVKGGIELLEVYPHPIDCIRPRDFNPAYVTSREEGNKGVLHLPIETDLFKIDEVFGGFVDKLNSEANIDLEEVDSDKTGPSGHLMNYGCVVRYPYDTRKYWHMPLTTTRNQWKLDSEEEIMDHCIKYQKFLRRFQLFFMNCTNSIEQFTDQLSPWEKTWPPRENTIKPHLFFSHGSLVFDGRTNVVHRKRSEEHLKLLIHQPCHFPHFPAVDDKGDLMLIRENKFFYGKAHILQPGQVTIPLEDKRDMYVVEPNAFSLRVSKGAFLYIPGDVPQGELTYSITDNPQKFHPALRLNLFSTEHIPFQPHVPVLNGRGSYYPSMEIGQYLPREHVDLFAIAETRMRLASEGLEVTNNCLTGGTLSDVLEIHSRMAENTLAQGELIKKYDMLYKGDTRNGIEKCDNGPDALHILHPRLVHKPRPFGKDDESSPSSSQSAESDHHPTRGQLTEDKSLEEEESSDSDIEDTGVVVQGGNRLKQAVEDDESYDSDDDATEEEQRHNVGTKEDEADDEEEDDDSANVEDAREGGRTDESSTTESDGDTEDQQTLVGIKSPGKSPARKKLKSQSNQHVNLSSEQAAAKFLKRPVKPPPLPAKTMSKRKLRSQGKASLDGLPEKGNSK